MKIINLISKGILTRKKGKTGYFVFFILYFLFCQSLSFASEVSVNQSSRQVEFPNSSDHNQDLKNLARQITVKVYAGNTSGSGIIIRKDNNIYTVVTNDHVLARGKNDFRIETLDKNIYSATIIPHPQFNNYDLGLLQFSSDQIYQVATLGDSNQLQLGDRVVATGFPITTDINNDSGFNFTEGLITMITPKSLEDGYQIGYTNMILKGMSGGPVLNSQGEVIAINGMHAYPLWGDPYVYQDGDQPSPEQKEVMSRSSWAIPINTFLKLTNINFKEQITSQ